MDLGKIQNLNLPSTPGESTKTQTPVGGDGFKDTFKSTLEKMGVTPGGLQPNAVMPNANVAKAALDPNGVKFSNHAIERMQSRGIKYSPEDVQKINEAVSKAAAKGSKDSLILMNDSALIVSVKNKTIVTVMDKTALKENVFTNIDSTIVM